MTQSPLNFPTPAGQILREYPEVRDAVAPLVALAETNPHLLAQVIEMALLLGVGAAEQRLQRLVDVVADQRYAGFGNAPVTYGQIMRGEYK